jgi:hypothetical protein
MIKKLGIVALVWAAVHFTGCSSNQIKSDKDYQVAAVGMDRQVNPEEKLPDWINVQGIQGSNMVSVGIAEANSDASPIYLRRAAMLDGESQLFQRAPHEYREMVQNAIEGMGIDAQQFKSIQTKLLRLSGVSGVTYPMDKSLCTKMARDNGDMIKVTRVCYQQAVVPLDAMNKTIERTIAQFYGGEKSKEFTTLMNQELNKIEGSKDVQATQQSVSPAPDNHPLAAGNNVQGSRELQGNGSGPQQRNSPF